VQTLGVEPAENIAPLARDAGIETLCEFFTAKLATKIREEGGAARIIIARHVLAHVDALLDFVEGLRLLLADDGVVIIEVPHLVDLLERVEYDTIYDEHLSYFSLSVLTRLFGLFSMEIFDVQRLAIHGGSVLVYIQKRVGGHCTFPVVTELLNIEKELHLDSPVPYIEFARKVEHAGGKLNWTLSRFIATGSRIVGYGAAAKGNILLNYCGIGPSILDYILDKNTLKHHLYTPGMHIPVLPVETLKQDQPDYMVILAWNFAEEIMAQQAEYRERGGKFIIPVPEVSIV
jgi:hypothetical protein